MARLDRRLARLEAEYSRRGAARREAARQAAARAAAADGRDWDAAVAEVGRLLGGGPGVAAVAAYAAGQLESRIRMAEFLHAVVPPDARPPVPSDAERREPAAAALFFARLPADARVRAATPAALDPDGARRGWAAEWIARLAHLETRLPPDLPAAAAGRLAAAFADPALELADFDQVCVFCGVRHPLVWPPPGGPFCESCVHCGGAVSGRRPAGSHAWQEAARRELDGFARPGRRPPPRGGGR